MTEEIAVRRVAGKMLQVVRGGVCYKGEAMVEGMVAFDVFTLPCP